MPVQLRNRTAVLREEVGIDEVDGLVAWLDATPRAAVNLRDCTHLHTAVVQLLAERAVPVSAPPADAFLRSWVLPLLTAR